MKSATSKCNLNLEKVWGEAVCCVHNIISQYWFTSARYKIDCVIVWKVPQMTDGSVVWLIILPVHVFRWWLIKPELMQNKKKSKSPQGAKWLIYLLFLCISRQIWASHQPAVPQTSTHHSSAHTGQGPPGHNHISIFAGCFSFVFVVVFFYSVCIVVYSMCVFLLLCRVLCLVMDSSSKTFCICSSHNNSFFTSKTNASVA